MNKKIAIMGVGMVGGALYRFFDEVAHRQDIITYDPPRGLDNVEELNTAEIIFICVPTPYDDSKGGFDTSYIDAALGVLHDEKIVVIKSTVLPGTTESYQERFPQHTFLFNPEFLTEATADEDTRNPHRQIIGARKQDEIIAREILGMLPQASFEMVVSPAEAEMVKYYNNAFYALKVTFANQMYDLCEALHIDYDKVKQCAIEEPMMGKNHFDIFHKGYRGYGGKCLPKDVRSLIQIGKEHGVSLTVLEQAEEFNNSIKSLNRLFYVITVHPLLSHPAHNDINCFETNRQIK